MKINIAASHRFHLLDLARELQNLGHEVKFYSYVPKKRVESFGVHKHNIHSMFLLGAPFVFLEQKIVKNSYFLFALKCIVLDFYVSFFMRKCDVFIALGTVYKKSFITAKKKYRATTIVEWGSKHIVEQLKCFQHLPNWQPRSKKLLERDIFAYNNADYISIPSHHVKESFLQHNYPESKLLVNPYGVDLTQFYPTKLQEPAFDLIYVGGWRYEKGCQLMVETCKKHNYTLLHVGALVNMDFPKDKNFTHIDSVDQRELVNYYAKAKVFILPSFSEGMAMVQLQAIVCGLPIMCSKHTGGIDLRELVNEKQFIIEMQDLSVEELKNGIDKALVLANKQTGYRSYSENLEDKLSWEAYGKRYFKNLEKILLKN